MIYRLQPSRKELSHIIKSFWMIDSQEDAEIRKEKIIPDGYPEMIFHYGDPYRINISGDWELQAKELVAGQIRNHFFLENTGTSQMFAIKFQPWAIKELFGLEMSALVDNVIETPVFLQKEFAEVKTIAVGNLAFEEKVSQIEEWFLHKNYSDLNVKYKAVQLIHEKNGLIQLSDLVSSTQISERTLERYFKTYVGLSPKFYSRIIRFSSIFKLIQEEPVDWQDVIFKAGYYDQSHFIKNFQEFTGEDPSRYGFSKQNMANLFLKK